MRTAAIHGVSRAHVVGISYGGFVGYSMAAQFPTVVDRLVLCCAGVCMEEKDMEEGLFQVKSVEEAMSILLPQTPEKVRDLMRLSFVKPAKVMPSCFLEDFIDVSHSNLTRRNIVLSIHLFILCLLCFNVVLLISLFLLKLLIITETRF